MANWLMVAFTAVIAFATIFLWCVTKRSADAARASAEAARISADAAKKSADVDAALHRPYVGVSVFQRQNDYNADLWAICCRVKNYGTLPACGVEAKVLVDRNGRGPYGEGPLFSGCEILPKAELDLSLPIGVDAEARAQLSSGGWPMVGHVDITYFGLGDTRYTHKADFRYDRTTQNFRPERSETKTDQRRAGRS